MFEVNSWVDQRFQVTGLCSDDGGMGTLLFVRDSHAPADAPPCVLKYCKVVDPDEMARFRREVSTMQTFAGNPFVAQILYANLNHSPPFFVMPFFQDGDLLKHIHLVQHNPVNAESCFMLMIECIAQLHSRGVFHRDIKPQNFLVGRGTIVVSDLGLCRTEGATAQFTRSSMWGGTPAYMPPEFRHGGFKGADAACDIYMLGQSFVVMYTGSLMSAESMAAVPPSLRVVFERACAEDKSRRYQTLAELRQSLDLAFAVLNDRLSPTGGVRGALQAILDRWTSSHETDQREIETFVSSLVGLDEDTLHKVCMELTQPAFEAIGDRPMPPQTLNAVLSAYANMASRADYTWSFAEVIADGMKVLFHSPATTCEQRAEALRIAIVAADRQNRFAAMDTCTAMIASIADEELAHRAAEVLMQQRASFTADIDTTTCRSPLIRHVIGKLKESQASTTHSVLNFLNS